ATSTLNATGPADAANATAARWSTTPVPSAVVHVSPMSRARAAGTASASPALAVAPPGARRPAGVRRRATLTTNVVLAAASPAATPAAPGVAPSATAATPVSTT